MGGSILLCLILVIFVNDCLFCSMFSLVIVNNLEQDPGWVDHVFLAG